jgi:hypothetical protein
MTNRRVITLGVCALLITAFVVVMVGMIVHMLMGSRSSPVARTGDTEVRFVSASVGRIKVKLHDGPEQDFDDVSRLQVKCKVTNSSEATKIDYGGWSDRPLFPTLPAKAKRRAYCRDEFGNKYNLFALPLITIIGQNGSDSIYPGKSIDELLVFEKPVAAAKHLTAVLPAEDLGGTGDLEISFDAPSN